MTLMEGEYKISDDGIWIPKAVLEEWKKYYCQVANGKRTDFKSGTEVFKYPLYLGKVEVLVDLLKMFEPLEG